MTSEMIRKISEILGVSEDSISAMDSDILSSMQSVLETIRVDNEADQQDVYNALDRLWQKGTVYVILRELSAATGIPYVTLKNLDYDTQQTLAFEYMTDSSQTERFYAVTNKALAIMELGKVAKLVAVSVRELRKLPIELQEKICGCYAMEFDEDSTNADLIDEIRELMVL